MKNNKHLLTIAMSTLLLLAGNSAYAGGDAMAGKEKSATCAACHGPDGNSPAPTFPNIAGQHADYLVESLKAYKSGKRQNAIMAGMVAALTEEDMENLAAFYASQTGLKVVE